METYTYPHLPAEVSTVHVALYSNVSNAKELKERLVSASNLPGPDGDREREIVNYAFVDAKLVTSRLQIQTAVYQATLAQVQRSLRTKSIHSEVLWVLNPTHNITDAIKRFGVSESSTALVVIRVCSPAFTPSDFQTGVAVAVKGDLTPLSSLEEFTDWDRVRKYYKLNADPAVQASARRGSGQENTEPCSRERSLMDQIVVSYIAMKSVSA